MQRKYSASRCIKSRFTSISATAGDGRLPGETSVSSCMEWSCQAKITEHKAALAGGWIVPQEDVSAFDVPMYNSCVLGLAQSFQNVSHDLQNGFLPVCRVQCCQIFGVKGCEQLHAQKEAHGGILTAFAAERDGSGIEKPDHGFGLGSQLLMVLNL